MPNGFCFKSLKTRWPSSVVARIKVEMFTGGMIKASTMANEDSAGTGPEGAFLFRGKMVYPVDSLIAWLEHRAKHPKKITPPTAKRSLNPKRA